MSADEFGREIYASHLPVGGDFELPQDATVSPVNESTLSIWDKLKDVASVAKDDFRNTTWRGKVILGSLIAMGAYEWGPGNETVTPLIVGQSLGILKGVGGVALTAAIGGGVVVGQQLTSGFLARKTAEQFPTVGSTAYHHMNDEREVEEVPYKPFKDLPPVRKWLYSNFLGSSFNVLRETAVTGEVDQNKLKRVSRTSSFISGSTVAVLSGATEVVEQSFGKNAVVELGMNWGVKNPAFWLGVMGVSLAVDKVRSKRASRNTGSDGEEG